MRGVRGITAALRSAWFFRYWLGHGAILFVLAAGAAAWRKGSLILAACAAIGALFWIESSTGYCRRCTHFNCGPHGALMRRFFRRDLSPLPRARLWLHLAFDLTMAAAGLWLIVSEWPALLAPCLLWLAGASVSVAPYTPEARRDASKWGARARGGPEA